MLKIRLSRIGKKHAPHYRVVVVPERSKRDGEVVDKIGEWHPNQNLVKLDRKAYGTWLTKGAKPSQTVRGLFNEKTT